MMKKMWAAKVKNTVTTNDVTAYVKYSAPPVTPLNANIRQIGRKSSQLS